MSNVNPNDNQQTEMVLPELPPMGSTSGLDPTQKLPARRVTGTINQALAPTQEFIIPVAGQTNVFDYTGQNLVDRNGVIVRTQYAGTYDEAYQELAKLEPAERKAFLKGLQKVGVYDGASPSADGFDNRDFAAVARAMLWANTRGVTLDVALPMMASEIGPVSMGGTRIRTTPKQDLRMVFKQATQSVLGRNVSDAEVEKFVRAYQGMEVTEGRGGATAPSPQAAAVEQVQEQYETEADAVGMMRLAEAFNQAIRGLG